MPDYILRMAAEYVVRRQRGPNRSPAQNAMLDRIRYEVMKVPAADVAPVVHGEWIGNKGGFWEMATCSMCDEKYPCVGMAPNFCPNCGARMDGAAE